jgi:hypothetical protein
MLSRDCCSRSSITDCSSACRTTVQYMGGTGRYTMTCCRTLPKTHVLQTLHGVGRLWLRSSECAFTASLRIAPPAGACFEICSAGSCCMWWQSKLSRPPWHAWDSARSSCSESHCCASWQLLAAHSNQQCSPQSCMLACVRQSTQCDVSPGCVTCCPTLLAALVPCPTVDRGLQQGEQREALLGWSCHGGTCMSGTVSALIISTWLQCRCRCSIVFWHGCMLSMCADMAGPL